MKNIMRISLLITFICLSTMTRAAVEEILTLEQLRATTNNLDTANVLVAVMPITDYVINSSSQTNIQVFFDGEIKITDAAHVTTNAFNQIVIVRPVVKFIGATFNNNVSLYLDARTNDCFAIYFWDLETKGLIRLEQEHYDSLLEAIVNRKAQLNIGGFNNSLFADATNPLELLPATPYIYIVIDGNRLDPKKKWFGAWNNQIEVHALRLYPWGEFETNHLGFVPWVPLEFFWFETVPDFLKIDTNPNKYWPTHRYNEQEPNYLGPGEPNQFRKDVLKKRSAFWIIMDALRNAKKSSK